MDQLHELHVQARPDIYKPLHPRLGEKEYADWLAKDDRYFYVAEHVEAGKVIGFSSAQLTIIQLQADHLELTVSTFNSHAQAFYEQMGLRVRSSRMEFTL